MQAPSLPSLFPVGSSPAPLATSTNPGCIDPASQSYPPVNPSSHTSPSSSAVMTSSGEGGQRLDLRETDQAKTTGHGLPMEVAAGSVSHAHMIPPTVAATTPPAQDSAAINSQPGGLPANVNIR